MFSLHIFNPQTGVNPCCTQLVMAERQSQRFQIAPVCHPPLAKGVAEDVGVYALFYASPPGQSLENLPQAGHGEGFSSVRADEHQPVATMIAAAL